MARHGGMNEAPTRVAPRGHGLGPQPPRRVVVCPGRVALGAPGHPDAQVALAGRNMGPNGRPTQVRGARVGQVDNAAATYDTPSVVVVPLHAGSGMRIKIAEALAAGRPIVTTTKGMTGLSLKHEEHVMVADSAEHFAKALVDLLSDGDKASALGQRGRAWAQANLQNRARAERLTAFLEELVDS